MVTQTKEKYGSREVNSVKVKLGSTWTLEYEGRVLNCFLEVYSLSATRDGGEVLLKGLTSFCQLYHSCLQGLCMKVTK